MGGCLSAMSYIMLSTAESQNGGAAAAAGLVGRRRARQRRRRRPGLSSPHISPGFGGSAPSYQNLLDIPHANTTSHDCGGSVVSVDGGISGVEWWPEGSLIRVKKPKRHVVRSSLSARSALRSVVTDFSRASRRRLLHTLGRVRRDHLPVFVTLTYPGSWPASPVEWKRHLDIFAKRLRRAWPGSAFVWKLEPQRRGAPHFHLLLWGADYSQLRGWLPGVWYEVVASGDARHLRAGTRVEFIRSWRGVCSYASKYMGKPVMVSDDSSWVHPGRWWGVVNRDSVPWSAVSFANMYYWQCVVLMRWLRRYASIRGRDYSSLAVLVESPDTWLENLDRMAFQEGWLPGL